MPDWMPVWITEWMPEWIGLPTVMVVIGVIIVSFLNHDRQKDYNNAVWVDDDDPHIAPRTYVAIREAHAELKHIGRLLMLLILLIVGLAVLYFKTTD
tara:strand:- start:236 stop:526 length:291 start_codon:yes stop_codon:yes gene_type:complete